MPITKQIRKNGGIPTEADKALQKKALAEADARDRADMVDGSTEGRIAAIHRQWEFIELNFSNIDPSNGYPNPKIKKQPVESGHIESFSNKLLIYGNALEILENP